MTTPEPTKFERGYEMQLSTDKMSLDQPTCQVNRVYSKNGIPSWRILGDEFVKRISIRFAFERAPRDMATRLESLESMSDMIRDNESVAYQFSRMEFKNGVYVKEEKGGAKRATRITEIVVSPQQIFVYLQGDTETALEIADIVAREICDVAHIPLNDLENDVQYLDYSTSSKVELGSQSLIGDMFLKFLQEDIAKHPGYGKYFVPEAVLPRNTDVHIVTNIDAVLVNVRVVNLQTGNSYSERLHITAEDANDAAKGIYVIQSKLPTKQHLEMCKALAEKVGAKT